MATSSFCADASVDGSLLLVPLVPLVSLVSLVSLPQPVTPSDVTRVRMPAATVRAAGVEKDMVVLPWKVYGCRDVAADGRQAAGSNGGPRRTTMRSST